MCVQQTSDGGFIICGSTTNIPLGPGITGYLIKTDGNGEEEWSQTFGGGWDQFFSLEQTSDGGFIVCGFTESFGNGMKDVFLVKIDENGEEEWFQTFGGYVDDYGTSVQQTPDGGYIIIGWTGSFGSIDGYLIKTDGNGEEEWSQTFGGLPMDQFLSGQQTTDGGFIMCGSTESFGNGMKDVYLIKTDGNGNEEWSQTFGGTGIDSGNSVQQTTDGGYIITGNTHLDNNNDDQDIYLIKTDSQGNVTSTIELPTPTSKRELIKTTNILGQENTTIKNQPLI